MLDVRVIERAEELLGIQVEKAGGFPSERTALRWLERVTDTPVAPRLLAEDERLSILLIEDLGNGPSLRTALCDAGGDSGAAALVECASLIGPEIQRKKEIVG